VFARILALLPKGTEVRTAARAQPFPAEPHITAPGFFSVLEKSVTTFLNFRLNEMMHRPGC
jgi:hypothetical protein